MYSKNTKFSKPQTPQYNEKPDEDSQRFLYILNSVKTPSRNSKTPSCSSRIRIGAYHNSNFAKLLPNDLSFNKERLVEENNSFKIKASEITEENLKLKTKLCELLNEHEQDSNKILSGIRKKIRLLQNEISNKDDILTELELNAKSSKLYEYFNEVDSYIKEACRLKFLIERIFTSTDRVNSSEFESTMSHLSIELQSLRKENIHLCQSKFQAEHDLQVLTSKLDKLQYKKTEVKLKKKLKKHEKILEDKRKVYQDQLLILQSKKEKLESGLEVEKKINFEKLSELEKNERRIQQQDLLINKLKEKLDKEKVLRNRRNMTFVPAAVREQLEIKLINPPRLLAKLNQILKKKKMLISVLLSLLDTNNNGQVHHNNFVTGLKSYGKRIKQRHLDEINKHLQSDSKYIDLNKLEDLYERYRYEDTYKSSSDEEAKTLKRPQPSSPTSPLSPKLPEEKKIPQKPILALQPVQDYPEKLPEKKIKLLTPKQLSKTFETIKSSMLLKKMNKGKLAIFLFGNNFDPDENLSIAEVEKMLKENVNFEGIPELAKYLIEPESEDMKESQYMKLKGCLRNGFRKVLKHLPDWEVFTDAENEEFDKVLKESLTVKYQKVMRNCAKYGQGSIKFDEFVEALRAAEVFLADRMVSWLMVRVGLRNKTEKFNFHEFLKDFQAIEPVFAVKPDEFQQKFEKTEEKLGFNVENFVKIIAGVLKDDSSLYPSGFLSFDSDHFLEFVHSLPVSVNNEDLLTVLNTFSEGSHEKFTKKFVPDKFLAALQENGFSPIDDECYSSNSHSVSEEITVEDKVYSDEKFEEDDEKFKDFNEKFEDFNEKFEEDDEKKSEQENYEEQFESEEENFEGKNEICESFEKNEESVEEGKIEHAENDTSLEFEEYGIRFK